MNAHGLFPFRQAARGSALKTRFPRDCRGLAAIEFGLIASFLAFAALNMADLAIYSRDRLQVENAAAMGTQAAFNACPLAQVPATSNCPTLNSAVTTAVHSTGLANAVSL